MESNQRLAGSAQTELMQMGLGLTGILRSVYRIAGIYVSPEAKPDTSHSANARTVPAIATLLHPPAGRDGIPWKRKRESGGNMETSVRTIWHTPGRLESG